MLSNRAFKTLLNWILIQFQSDKTSIISNNAIPNGNGEIYRIWFDNDETEKSYVGQTIQGAYKRVRQHIVDANRNDPSRGCPLLDQATRIYGVSHMHYEIVENGIGTRSELDKAERYWIRAYECQYPNGYNVTSGGQEGSSKVRVPMSEKGYYKRKNGKIPMFESQIELNPILMGIVIPLIRRITPQSQLRLVNKLHKLSR